MPRSRELYSHTFSHLRPTDWWRIDWLANNWLTNLQISDWKTKSYMQARSQGQEGERPWERGSVTCRLADRWCPVRIAQSQSLMFVNLTNIFTRWNANRSYSLQTVYLIFESHFKFFFQQFPWILQLQMFFIKWYQKEWSIKLRIVNDGWHETLYLLHVSRREMLHFVTSYMKQSKNRKQILESTQNGLEVMD